MALGDKLYEELLTSCNVTLKQQAVMASLGETLAFYSLSHPITLLAGLVILILTIYWSGTSSYMVLKRLNLPGPKPVPFFGNILDATKAGGLHKYQLQCLKKFGKVFTQCIGSTVGIVVADPEILKQIMVKQFTNFQDRRFGFKFPPPMEYSVLLATGDTWKRIRETLTPSFSSAKLKLIVKLVEDASDKLIVKLKKVADTGKSFDVQYLVSPMTLDVILLSAFGVETDVQTNPESELLGRSKRVFQRPTGTFFRILPALPLGWLFRKIIFFFREQPLAYFQSLALRIVDIRRQEMERGTVKRMDLLQLMLNAHQKETSEERTHRKLSDEEITAQSVVFMLAGHETTSNAICFTAYYLALNPEVQERLKTEIETAVVSNPEIPTYELIGKIEYLDCVINEVLRLNPPIFNMNRQCKKACNINGIPIPEGMQIVIPFYALHNDPDAWPDVDRFDPERFRGPEKDKRHPYQFLPFGAGPRSCIGMRLALMEVKITIVKILRRFKFVRCSDTQVPIITVPGATLSAQSGIYLKLQSINGSKAGS